MNGIKKLSVAVAFFICSCAYGQSTDSVSITYIANSGYFIELGNKNILIDAVFDDYSNCDRPDSLFADKLFRAENPFNKLDFVLITHNHSDHVSDSLIIELLKRREDFNLILPRQVYLSIEKRESISRFADRVHAIELAPAETTQITIGNTIFDIARSKHADTYDIENLCFIVNDNGFRLLHTGDCWPVSILDIEKEYFSNVDLAIIPIALGKDKFETYRAIIKPRYTLISHVTKDLAPNIREIMKNDTATFSNMDVLIEHYERIVYER